MVWENIFNANAKPGDPLSYEALQTRRKIAEQLMGKRSPYPKNVGEGIASIGESISDAWQMNRLDAAEKQQAAYEKNVLSGGPPLPGSENTAVAPAGQPASRPVSDAGTDTTAPVQTAAAPGQPLDVTPSKFANVRFNNPGAQYPVSGENATAFGQQGAGTIGGGHKIAQFPTPVQGAAANMDLLDRNYTGTTIGDAINKWSGGGRRNVPGFNTDTVITKEMMRDPSFAIPFMQAVAGGEAPGRYPMNADQWAQAHNMFTGVRGGTPPPLPPSDPRGRITQAVVDQAEPDSAPVRTAALTTPGVASDASPAASAVQAVAALPTQQSAPAQTPPLIPGSGPPITTDVKPMPVAQAAPGTIPPSQAGMALPVPPKPRDPGPQPTMPPPTPTMNWLDSIARNRGLNPEMRADAQSKYNNLLKVQHDVFTNDLKAHKEDVRKFNDPATAIALTKAAYDAEAEKRKLEGEGFFELSPEEKARMGPDIPGVKLYKDRYGNLQKIVGPQTVSIDMAGEKAEAQGIGKHTAERHGKMMESANTAGNSLYTLNRAEALLNKIDTNALAPASLTVGAFGRALGISDEALASLNLKPEQIGSRQAFNAIVGDLVIGKIGAGGFPSNNFSNTDRTFLTDTVAKLGDDPESNRIKLASAKLVARRDLEKAQDWSVFRNAPENKGKSFVDFEDHWNAKINKLDVTGELQKQAATVIAAAGANVPPEAINMLRANPASAEKFDKVFGTGASKRYLGQ